MLIEVDHMSELARDRVLTIAAAAPLPGRLRPHRAPAARGRRRSCAPSTGTAASPRRPPTQPPELARKLLGFRDYRSPKHYFGVGLGTDTGGFSSLPGPPRRCGPEPARLSRSSPTTARSRFTRQHTGDRFFDLNTDGVAHYGLFADLLADVQRAPDGGPAMRTLFRSAEAYLQMWELARGR